jgi:hypothetical protein
VLEGIPRFGPYPTHVPALFVNVLFLNRQTADIANQFFGHYLAAFVQGDLDDVPRLVHSAPYVLALSVGASGSVDGLTGSILPLLGRASSGLLSPPRSVLRFSLRGLTGLARCLPDSVAGAFGCLSCRISNSLGCLARTLGGLSGSLASFLGSLASAFAHVSGSLTRTLAHFLRSLAGAFTYLLSGLSGSLTDVFDGRAGSRTDVLDG